MVSAFVSYVGYFTKRYRQELIQNSWLPFFKEVKVIVATTISMCAIYNWILAIMIRKYH